MRDAAKRIKWPYAALAALGLLTGDMPALAQNVPPTQIGVNLASGVRSFANLMIGDYWRVWVRGGKVQRVRADDLDDRGNLRRVSDEGVTAHPLMQPQTPVGGAKFQCRYAGRGSIKVTGEVSDVAARPGSITFRFEKAGAARSSLAIQIKALDAADPIRDIDCREADMPASARFDPAFISSLKGFKVLRFMDWERTNANAEATWAKRATLASTGVSPTTGASIEDMVDLAVQLGADPWFTIPWNADPDYIMKFARLVHDRLPRQRRVYVELGNEVWNYGFEVAHQALKEADANPLSPNRDISRTYRYAARTVEVMKIWEQVFRDSPARLVRVIATQSVVPASAGLVLGYRDTADHVDALATAPYFGFQLVDDPSMEPSKAFEQLDGMLKKALRRAAQNKAIAQKYGKRYITYEGGQHVVLKDVALVREIERDPRMYDLYKQYIATWRTSIGDVMMLYSSSGSISKYGAWGMSEYIGQPLENAPKMRAVKEELAHK